MNTKTRLCGILILLVWGITSCDHKDYKWDILGEDFETPVLTDQNTIQFMVHLDERQEFEINGNGRMVIEWGDGKMAKVGYGEELEVPSHKYMPGSYRVKIWCEELTSLNIGDDVIVCSDIRFGSCPKLEGIYIDARTKATSLDFSGCYKLKYLRVVDVSGLESVDVSQCADLELLYINSQPQLTQLDVSHNLELQSLECNNCSLAHLSLKENRKLQHLGCLENRLTALDLSENRELSDISCEGNLLKELDLTSLFKLHTLFCDGNRLTSLSIAPGSLIRMLSCTDNLLDVEALNAIFLNLPDYSEREWNPGQILFSSNPGEKECDAGILAVKNWTIREPQNDN